MVNSDGQSASNSPAVWLVTARKRFLLSLSNLIWGQYMRDDLEKLAKLINKAVYEKFHDYKTTIFLCGADPDTSTSVRAQLDKAIRTRPFWYRYDVFYPEDLFEELLVGPGHQDLITLENILADSVDAVVLIIESWGAVAELGSFASNEKLRKKLVVISDRKHRRSKSFINYGPLRLMSDTNEGEVVFGDFNSPLDLLPDIRRKVAKVRRATDKTLGVKNVVQAHHFVMSCVYLLEPVTGDDLLELVMHASEEEEKVAEALTAGALSVLMKRREIETHADGYRLSDIGARTFLRLGLKGRTKYSVDLSAMDLIRVDVLNSQLRRG